MGCKKGVIQHKWTDEEIQYLKEIYPSNGRKKTTELINKRFAINITESSVGSKTKKLGIRCLDNGCFKKGNVPQNKGQKMSEKQYEKCKNTMFKKGNKPNNTKPIGTERITKDGYIEIKLADRKWELLHRLIMQSIIGRKLKKSEIVIFGDGNKQNLDINNLILTERTISVRLNQIKYEAKDKSITKAAVETVKLMYLVKEKNGSKGNNNQNDTKHGR